MPIFQVVRICDRITQNLDLRSCDITKMDCITYSENRIYTFKCNETNSDQILQRGGTVTIFSNQAEYSNIQNIPKICIQSYYLTIIFVYRSTFVQRNRDNCESPGHNHRNSVKAKHDQRSKIWFRYIRS